VGKRAGWPSTDRGTGCSVVAGGGVMVFE